MKIALAMIVRPDDAEAILLDRCLQSVYQYVDGIFITQAGQAPNEQVSRVAKSYDAQESFWKWNDSFADARNFNFSQVPKDYDYITWLDADDVVRGYDKLKPTLEAHPSLDVLSFWYLYAFDEWNNPVVVHHKTRVIRNDGCVEWEGNLHEDFKQNRQISHKHVEGIEVLHLTNNDRIAQSQTRNVHVAQVHLETHPDDPRSYWNVGNSLKAAGKHQEAIDALSTFLKLSLSDDEKYIARLRRAEAYISLEQKDLAIDELRYAIGMKPDYPDAYIGLGRLFYDMHRYQEALQMLKLALTLKPPYYSIVVYNPRDYDYEPLKYLAYTYLAVHQPILAFECLKSMLEITPRDKKLKGLVELMEKRSKQHEKMLEKYNQIKDLPKDKMKKEIDKLPADFKAEPMFTNLRNLNFIKETSSGKDLVILCGYTEREWTPKAVEEGIGGSEEAVIHLAKRFKKAGWNVTVYNNCGHKSQVFDGVTYAPFWTWNYRDKQDVTILWRHPLMADHDINSTKIFLDLHDVVKQGEFTEKRLAKIDKIFVKSHFHRSLFPNVPDEKFVIVPNGIVNSDFAELPEKDPYLMVNTSSPDRSLSTLVRLFKRVKEQVPEAKCEWAYGFGVFDVVHKNNPAVMAWKEQLLKDMDEVGIVNRGRLSHQDVADMYKRATIFAYPTEFAEIDCISARKAQAAGAIPVTTDFAALDETVQYGVKVHSEKTKDTWCAPYQFDFALNNPEAESQWVDWCVALLKSEAKDQTEMRKWTEQFDWDRVCGRWLSEIDKEVCI